MTKNPVQNLIERPPVVVVMGHIDHGKSTLLDFIRSSDIVSGEAGGITQHLGAYEIEHKGADGTSKKITFLDTPGHEAFCGVRSRGSKVADTAILIVSAEDGVMPQTLEALECIKTDKLPFIVAINKIDSPKSNVEKVKNDLVENGIYIEGYGGSIPAVEISAKAGTNVNDLLDLILIGAEVEGLKADTSANAEGFVIEAHKDKNRGISATVVIKNGTLKQGQFIICESEGAYSPIRIFEDHDYNSIKSATVSKPVHVCGWSDFPVVGSKFKTFNSKKEAEKCREEIMEKKREEKTKKKEVAGQKNSAGTGEKFAAGTSAHSTAGTGEAADETFTIPIIIKCDTHGSIEAVEHELKKILTKNSKTQVVLTGTGNISEIDVKTASGNENAIIVGFGIEIDKQAEIMVDRLGVSVKTFDIIYDLVDWLSQEVEKKRPRIEVEEMIGKAKILKKFNESKSNQVLGARSVEGKLRVNGEIKVLRRGEEIARGRIKELQSHKAKVSEVGEGEEFGLCVEAKLEILPGDEIEVFEKVKK